MLRENNEVMESGVAVRHPILKTRESPITIRFFRHGKLLKMLLSALQ